MATNIIVVLSRRRARFNRYRVYISEPEAIPISSLVYLVGPRWFTYDALQQEYPLLFLDPQWYSLFTIDGKVLTCCVPEAVIKEKYTVPEPKLLNVVAIKARPGYYLTVNESYVVQQHSNGTIIAIGLYVNDTMRPLTEEEETHAISMGIVVERGKLLPPKPTHARKPDTSWISTVFSWAFL